MFILPSLFMRCDKPGLTRWCLCILHAGIQISPDEVVGNRDDCRHSIAEALLMCPYVPSCKFSVLAPGCSRAYCIICSLHLIAVWFLQAIWLPEWSLQLPSFLFYVSKRHAGRSNISLTNALLPFCHYMKSAVHVPYAGWLISSCSAVSRTHDFKNFLSSI